VRRVPDANRFGLVGAGGAATLYVPPAGTLHGIDVATIALWTVTPTLLFIRFRKSFLIRGVTVGAFGV